MSRDRIATRRLLPPYRLPDASIDGLGRADAASGVLFRGEFPVARAGNALNFPRIFFFF